MERIRRSARLPRCSRCGGGLVVSAVAQEDDEDGRSVHLELCAVCDTGDVDRPVADLLVQWFTDGGGKDTGRAPEGAHLLMEWTKECMPPTAGTGRSSRPNRTEQPGPPDFRGGHRADADLAGTPAPGGPADRRVRNVWPRQFECRV
ncbi:DUF6300 family protein [Streptomyces sp. NPDC003444]